MIRPRLRREEAGPTTARLQLVIDPRYVVGQPRTRTTLSRAGDAAPCAAERRGGTMARVDGNGGPVTVGLAGAGAWTGMVHAPTFAAGPETSLADIWARRPGRRRGTRRAAAVVRSFLADAAGGGLFGRRP